MKSKTADYKKFQEIIMKKLLSFIQLGILSSLLFSASAFSSPSAPAQPELGKWWKNSEIVKHLQLSETQVDQIERTFIRHRPALAGLFAGLQKREQELKMLLKDDPIDESRVLAQTETVAESRTALEKENSAMMLDIRRSLTKEQWQKLQLIRDLRESGAGSAYLSPLPGEPQPGEKFYRIGMEGVAAPKSVYQPLPQYTPQAKEAKVEGIVLLQGFIRKNGHVDSLKIIRSLGYGLDERAMDVVGNEWRFEPGTFNGQPVDIQATFEISFRLY
jgi:TonB family protein